MLKVEIFERLKKEHNEVKSLLKKAEESESKDRAQILKKIEEAVVPHSRGEEKTLYAILLEKAQSQEKEDAADLTQEAYEEHHAVDQLMAELKATSVDDEKWLPKLTVIKENLEHHIKEEEGELFKKAKSLLSSEELESINASYEVCFEKYKESLPPQDQIRERTPAQSARTSSP